MAVDFMIMPISRYLAGDFVTPMMSLAWQQGVPYAVIGPEGRRELPKDTPFGGSRAPEQRMRFLPMLAEDLASLPAPIGNQLWDEASRVEPAFHRVDAESYQCLLNEAEAWRPRASLFGFWRRSDAPAHFGASLFLPLEFAAPFAMPVVFERVAGSAPLALKQLAAGGFSEAAASARATLSAALQDCLAKSLPMIVDW